LDNRSADSRPCAQESHRERHYYEGEQRTTQPSFSFPTILIAFLVAGQVSERRPIRKPSLIQGQLTAA
jgi:hypothetical protein